MESSLAILIPVSLLLVAGIAGVLWWAVKSGQFEDLEGEAFRMIMDQDDPPRDPPHDPPAEEPKSKSD